MKKILFLFLCLIAFSIYADARMSPIVSGGYSPPQGGQTFLLRERYESSGQCYSGDTTYVNCENQWSISTPVYNYATDPAPLEGEKSEICESAEQGYATFSPAQSEVYASTILNFTFTENLITSHIFSIWDDSGASLSSMAFTQTGPIRFKLYCGSSVSTYSAQAPTSGTTYKIQLYYKAGTGSNAECKIWFTTDGDFEGTPDFTMTNGTGTTNASRILKGNNRTTAQNKFIFDDIKVSTTPLSY